MDCYLRRRLKQELVRAEQAPGCGKAAPPRRVPTWPGRRRSERRGGDAASRRSTGPVLREKGREQTCVRGRQAGASERDREPSQSRPKCVLRSRGSKEGAPGTRMPGRGSRTGPRGAGGGCAAPTLSGAEVGRGTACSRGRAGTAAPTPHPQPWRPGCCGLARLRGRPAGCLPGLACQRGGGWQLDPRGRARRGRRGAARAARERRAEAQPDVRSGLGSAERACGGLAAGLEVAPSGGVGSEDGNRASGERGAPLKLRCGAVRCFSPTFYPTPSHSPPFFPPPEFR